MKIKKFKAGAMQLTLFIIVVIALMLTSVVLLVSVQKKFKVQSNFFIETIDNTNLGINYVLKKELEWNEWNPIELHQQDFKSLEVKKEHWGIFEIVTSKSKIKTFEFQKSAIIGGSIQEKNRSALWLEEKGKPLVLVGNSRIKGDVYLPQRGVKTGNISGKSYYGSSLVEGSINIINELPRIEEDILESLIELQHVKPVSMIIDRSKKNFSSFKNEIKYYYSTDEIVLEDVSLVGKYIIKSDLSIKVTENTDLQDVILVAPKIEVANSVNGTFQAVASKSVLIGKDCVLKYPSALVLVNEGNIKSNHENNIHIGQNSSIKGVVFYEGKAKENSFSPQIIIDENASVSGEVYCNENIELRGQVNGRVITSGFVVRHSGSVYQNHIHNGKILSSDLPLEFVGIVNDKSKKKVAKWLY